MNRSDLRGELLCGEIEDLRADQVGRHQIGRALHTFERAGYGSGQRLGCGGLGQSGNRFDENMAARHQGGDQGLAKIVLSDQGLCETAADLRSDVSGACDVFGRQGVWLRGRRHRDGRWDRNRFFRRE